MSFIYQTYIEMSSPNIYGTFIENCRKDDIIRVYYLQYNGNEEELTKLYNYVHQGAEAGYLLTGDLSSFDMEVNMLIPEQVVDLYTKFRAKIYVEYYKVDGKFECPITEEHIDGTNIHDLALTLDEMFYHGKIRYYFSK